jgi:uncharacterized membrane protein
MSRFVGFQLPDSSRDQNMSSTSRMVTAVFRSHANADLAYDQLLSHGYTNNEVNVLMADATRAKFYPHGKSDIKPETHAAAGTSIGGAVGTIIGAAIAAVVAIGTTIAIPGLGIFVAGPIALGLAGAGAGAVTGGVVGWLIGVGIPESNAKAYETALREGGVAVGVSPRSPEDEKWIKETFQNTHGENICTSN